MTDARHHTPDSVLGADHSRGNAGDIWRMAEVQWRNEQAGYGTINFSVPADDVPIEALRLMYGARPCSVCGTHIAWCAIEGEDRHAYVEIEPGGFDEHTDDRCAGRLEGVT